MVVCKPLWLPPPPVALKQNFDSSAIGNPGHCQNQGHHSPLQCIARHFFFGPVIWCLGQCKAMWPLANKVEEMLNLAKRIKASFHNIKQSEKELADCLAKE